MRRCEDLQSFCAMLALMLSTSGMVATTSGVAARLSIWPPDSSAAIKSQILQIAALTDRGQRLNTLIAPAYQEKRDDMSLLVSQLAERQSAPVTAAALNGEWELVFSEVELFRSSPFFLAIEEALSTARLASRL